MAMSINDRNDRRYSRLIQGLLGLALVLSLALAGTAFFPNRSDFWGSWWGDLSSEIALGFEFIGERLVTNWRGFLGLSVAAPTPSAAAEFELDARVRQLVEERLAEVLSEVADFSAESVGTADRGGAPEQGLVAVPSTGNPLGDRLLLDRLREIFSDPVSVRIDPSGSSGVITPRFREGPGSDYLFLLTPVFNQ